jgi:hypothetical protein
MGRNSKGQFTPSNSEEKSRSGNGATLGFGSKLWQDVEKVCNNTDAVEYNHVILNFTSGRQRVPAVCFHNFLVAVPPIDVQGKEYVR